MAKPHPRKPANPLRYLHSSPDIELQRVKSLLKFAWVRAPIHNYFSQVRYLVDPQAYNLRRPAALAEWESPVAWSFDALAVAVSTGDEFASD